MKHALTVSLAVTALLIAATAQADDNDSGEDFTWSAGVGVTVFETFNLRLEYEQFDIENIDDSNAL